MISSLRSLFLLVLLITGSALQVAAAEKPDHFSPYVDGNGGIVLPNEFRSTWIHLGTWVLTSTLAAGPDLGTTGPKAGIHNVYTQPGSFKSYRQYGKWPDGAVMVMEVRAITWDDLPTGHVIDEGEPLEWFVMIKDAKGRFTGNQHWGNGWGWALFKPATPKINASTSYKNDCLGCHEPAKASEMVFIQGYPTLR